MNALETKEFIRAEKLVVIVRETNHEKLLHLVDTITGANIKAIEFTTTIPDVYSVMEKVKSKHSNIIIGLGTVYKISEAELGIKAGADFINSPVLNLEIVDIVKKNNKLLSIGGFTPTEIYAAYNAGADLVKLFPASEFSPDFVQKIKKPMPFVDLFPTGGLSLITAIQYLYYGAIAVGMGNSLLRKNLIDSYKFDDLRELLIIAKSRINKMEI